MVSSSRQPGPIRAPSAIGGGACQLDLRADLRVLSDRDGDVDPGCGRVNDGDAGPHPVLEDPVVERPPCRRELNAVVDALDLRNVGGQHRSDRVPVAAQDPHHVGQVLLLLGVVGRHPFDRVREQRAVEGVAARVVLVDGELRRGGVALLHDAEERPVGVPHDPPVARRVTGGGQHRDGVAARVVNVHELAQRLAAQQRHVPVRDDDGAAEVAKRLGDHPHRVPGAELLVLDDDQRSW